MKTKAEILQLLGNYKPTAERQYGLTRIGIFGSVARGQQTETSDVDVCYESKPLSLLTIDLIQSDLKRTIIPYFPFNILYLLPLIPVLIYVLITYGNVLLDIFISMKRILDSFSRPYIFML